MKKSAIVMLTFSLIFVLITTFLFFFTTVFSVSSVAAFFKPDGDAGDKIGGIFLFIVMVPYCIGMFISSACILPFNLVMMLKMKIKAWYTIAILIFAISMMALAIIYLFAFPFFTNINSSSSSSISSSQA